MDQIITLKLFLLMQIMMEIVITCKKWAVLQA